MAVEHVDTSHFATITASYQLVIDRHLPFVRLAQWIPNALRPTVAGGEDGIAGLILLDVVEVVASCCQYHQEHDDAGNHQAMPVATAHPNGLGLHALPLFFSLTLNFLALGLFLKHELTFLFFLSLALFFLLFQHDTLILMGFHHWAENIMHIFDTEVAGIIELAQNLFLVAQDVEFGFADMTVVDSIEDGDVITTSLAVQQHVFQILDGGFRYLRDGIAIEVGNDFSTFLLDELFGDGIALLGIVQTVQVE